MAIGILFRAALLVWVALLPAASLAQETKAGGTKAPPSVDELVRYFDIVIFQSEFKTAKPSTIVKKWTGPLRLAIRSFDEITVEKDGREVQPLKQVKIKKPHIRFIQKHLNSLIKAAGLKTEDAKKTGKPSNFIITFVPRRQMGNPHLAKANPKLLRRMAAEGGCFFLLWADRTPSRAWSKGSIVIRPEPPSPLERLSWRLRLSAKPPSSRRESRPPISNACAPVRR